MLPYADSCTTRAALTLSIAVDEAIKQGKKAPPLPEVKCGKQCWKAKSVWCCRVDGT
jgi:hypothetical protein